MHRLAYARKRRRRRGAERRGAAGSQELTGSGSTQARKLAGFCLLPFAVLALYFAVFSAFSVFLDKFISRAAFFKNRRQFCALLALCWQSVGADSKKQAEHLPRLSAVGSFYRRSKIAIFLLYSLSSSSNSLRFCSYRARSSSASCTYAVGSSI